MTKKIVKSVARLAGLEVARSSQDFLRYEKLFDKYKAYTMVPKDTFLYNLDLCENYKSLAGEYVECGVWKGGISGALAESLFRQKQIHLFDSFEGLPAADQIDGIEALQWQANKDAPNYYNNCAVDDSYVLQAMALANHKKFTIHKGWFENTLPLFKDHSIAVLRLDGDWYDSTMTCLNNLFPQVIKGGIVLLDDYYTWDGCSRAVHDYLSKTKSSSRIYQWKNRVAFILKKE